MVAPDGAMRNGNLARGRNESRAQGAATSGQSGEFLSVVENCLYLQGLYRRPETRLQLKDVFLAVGVGLFPLSSRRSIRLTAQNQTGLINITSGSSVPGCSSLTLSFPAALVASVLYLRTFACPFDVLCERMVAP